MELTQVALRAYALTLRSYGRVFHPQILMHELIKSLVLFRITNRHAEQSGWDTAPEVEEAPDSCPVDSPTDPDIPIVLQYRHTDAGKEVKPGTELRILPVGDSITVGFLSDRNGGDSDGYRRQLKSDLSRECSEVRIYSSRLLWS